MLGYCSTGNAFIHTNPAITMMSETTVAKIGCSMKNFENMGWPLFRLVAFLCRLVARRRRWWRAARGWGLFCGKRLRRDRDTRLQTKTAVNDYLLAGLKSFVDKPIVTLPIANHHRT